MFYTISPIIEGSTPEKHDWGAPTQNPQTKANAKTRTRQKNEMRNAELVDVNHSRYMFSNGKFQYPLGSYWNSMKPFKSHVFFFTQSPSIQQGRVLQRERRRGH